MSHHSTTNHNHCDELKTKLNILCLLILVSLLSGQIKLSYAIPPHVSKEDRSQSAKTNKLDKTPSPAKWAKGRLPVTPRSGMSPEEFKNAELDMMVALDLTISDPFFNRSRALPKMDAPTAWVTANDDGMIFAILETGVNSGHPDLTMDMLPGWNTYDNNSDTTDVHNHGTWVAGTVAAAADNSARVDNISYGVVESSTIHSTAAYMRVKEEVALVSEGNLESLLTHATSDVSLAASATNNSDTSPSGSSYGKYIDIFAPDASISTTSRSGGNSNASSTSFSSPSDPATTALMLSGNGEVSPTDTDPTPLYDDTPIQVHLMIKYSY